MKLLSACTRSISSWQYSDGSLKPAHADMRARFIRWMAVYNQYRSTHSVPQPAITYTYYKRVDDPHDGRPKYLRLLMKGGYDTFYVWDPRPQINNFGQPEFEYYDYSQPLVIDLPEIIPRIRHVRGVCRSRLLLRRMWMVRRLMLCPMTPRATLVLPGDSVSE